MTLDELTAVLPPPAPAREQNLTFVAEGIAHDLNNVLAPINLLLDILRRQTALAG